MTMPNNLTNFEIEILEYLHADDMNTTQCASVSYKGSNPFSGIFLVHDVDTCIHYDTETDKKYLIVNCQWEDETLEDPEIWLEFHDKEIHQCIGFYGDVINRIGVKKQSS
jgi:hypothetical protein